MIPVSLFIGGIRPLPESGRPTGIYKTAVNQPVELGIEGFAGDRQADRRVHGGPEKAVHLYPSPHYARLAARFPEAASSLVPGSLGENIACDALDEEAVRVGDIWQLGETRLQVCQPRTPCWKIDERFAAEGMAAFIAEHRLCGWYWRVLTPGWVNPGDHLCLESAADAPTLGAALRLWHMHRPDPEELDTLAASPGIAAGWRNKILQRNTWLKTSPEHAPAPKSFHVKPDTP